MTSHRHMGKKLRLLLRAESALFKIRARRAMLSAGLLAVALLFVLMALVVSHVAGFEALEQSHGSITAGCVIAGIDLLMAFLLFRAALSEPKTSNEESLALEARDLTLESLTKDFAQISSEVDGFRRDVRQMREFLHGVLGFFSRSLNFFEPFADFVNFAAGAKASAGDDRAPRDSDFEDDEST